MVFRCFSENGDFVKIELPLWREHNFEGSHPPKIDPEGDSEHKKNKNDRKMTKKSTWGANFWPRRRFWVDFWVLGGTRKLTF